MSARLPFWISLLLILVILGCCWLVYQRSLEEQERSQRALALQVQELEVEVSLLQELLALPPCEAKAKGVGK